MNWIIVKKFPLETDLSAATGYLRQHGIAHQIYEESGNQVVAVSDPSVVEPLLQFLDNVTQGKIHIELHKTPQPTTQSSVPSFLDQIKITPITSLLIVLSVVGAFLYYVDPQFKFLYLFMFKRFSNFTLNESWRLITPVFIHFGFLHVLFNSLWMWDLGRRVEILLGKKWYCIFFVFAAIASNSAESLWSDASKFGGMSGVVYALVGFIMVSHKLAPHRLTAVSPGIIIFMLVWLVLCMTGMVDYFIDGGVANAAHLGGLLAGCAFALITTKILKLVRV